MYLPKKLTHLGIDETTLGMGSGNRIIVAAQTTNENLIRDLGPKSIDKAKDYIRKAAIAGEKIEFPTYSDLVNSGLETFHWTRASSGRFNLKQLQHASIAHVVHVNGYKPESTVLHIDAFHGNYEMSKYLIYEYLHRRDFKIPYGNINICGGGDQSIPIINYADLLAFQIGLYLNDKYKEYNSTKNSKKLDFNIEPQKIDFDEQRVMIPLDEKGRDILEQLLLDW